MTWVSGVIWPGPPAPGAATTTQLAEGNARQARKRVATQVLIRDEAGHVLLVNPTYKPHWHLPGGMVEANEPPRAAASRELREELDLPTPLGRLLLVEWVGPGGPWDDQLVFIFDGGVLNDELISRLKLNDPELSAYQFVPPDEAEHLLRPDVHQRLDRARQAQASDTTSYDETERDW
jgi:ADP-ribose pyrophosphatase YjhB (NUDIX family)